MAVTRTIRVIRTWHFTVAAEYGDTDSALTAKVSDEQIAEAAPDAEERIIMEAFASPVAKYSELSVPTNTEGDGE